MDDLPPTAPPKSKVADNSDSTVAQADAVEELENNSNVLEVPKALVKYVNFLRHEAANSSSEVIAMDMANQTVPMEIVTCLSDFVAQLNTRLVRVNLSKNVIGPHGTKLLGKALVTNNLIQFLSLDSCDLVGSPYRPQYEGIMALAKGIQSVRSNLRYIALANNNLQAEGCQILLGAVSFHRTLTALDISNNMLSIFNESTGYLALSYLLQYSRHLCWLDISDNPMPTRAIPLLQGSLAANASLTCLYAKRCNMIKQQWLAMPLATGTSVSQEPTETNLSCALLHTLEC